MAKFVEVPSFDIYKDGEWAKPEEFWLRGRCVYQSDLLDEEGYPIKVIVPDEYPTDFASIPKLARLLIPKNDNHRAPAVIHDYLCRTEAVNRKVADKIFFEAMGVVDDEVMADSGRKAMKPVYWLRKRAMYIAVRFGAIFGGKK